MMNARWIPVFVIAVLVGRYTLLSWSAYAYFWRAKREKYAHRRIQPVFPKLRQIRNEVKWSFTTFLVLALGARLVYPFIAAGRSKLYFEVSAHGWPYFFASVLFLIVGHDLYFYFAHRFMHLKPVFKHVHRIHHQSTNPSPLAAFSFHPLEAVIEGGFVGIAIFLVPLHLGALAMFLFYSHSMNVMGHLGYELFPRGWNRRAPMSWLNSATHHNLHHQYFNANYGLYFNFWDRVFGTNHPKYHEAFDAVTASQPAEAARPSAISPLYASAHWPR